MKKGIIGSLGVLVVVALIISGCSKSEEKKAEAPAAIKQTVQQKAAPVQEKAAAVKQEAAEMAAPAIEKAPTMTDQAVETAKEMGQQVLESASEKLPEEVKQAVDAVKPYSGALMEKTGLTSSSGQVDQAASEATKAASQIKAPAVVTEPVTKDAGSTVEQTIKKNVTELPMKLPSKY